MFHNISDIFALPFCFARHHQAQKPPNAGFNPYPHLCMWKGQKTAFGSKGWVDHLNEVNF